MPDVSYTIYRKAILANENGHKVQALVSVGKAAATGPKQAVTAWFAGLSHEEQMQMNGGTKFVVVPTSNHHELSPKIETNPRLVFS